MTDPQTFELRLAEAFARYVEDAPTSVDSIAMAVSAVGSVPSAVRWTWPWPTTPAQRALAIALAALLVLALLALGAGGLQRQRSLVTVTQPPAPLAAGPSLPAEVELPATIRGSTWITSGGLIPGVGQTDPLIRLVASADGTRLWVVTSASTRAPAFVSRSVAANPGQIGLVAVSDAGGCLSGDPGTYTMTPSADGGSLALTASNDSCANRQTTLEREWTRDLELASGGGRGVVAFDGGPVLGLTLPVGSWQAGQSSGPAYVILTEQGVQRGLIAAHNPVPASGRCGSAPDGPETIAEFVGHLRTVPGFTVKTTAEVIAGDPAARVTITTAKTANCPIGNMPAGTAVEYSAGGNTALLLPNTTETWNLVQVAHACGATTCSDLYLLGYLALTTAEEQQVFASVSFTESLPTGGPQ